MPEDKGFRLFIVTVGEIKLIFGFAFNPQRPGIIQCVSECRRHTVQRRMGLSATVFIEFAVVCLIGVIDKFGTQPAVAESPVQTLVNIPVAFQLQTIITAFGGVGQIILEGDAVIRILNCVRAFYLLIFPLNIKGSHAGFQPVIQQRRFNAQLKGIIEFGIECTVSFINIRVGIHTTRFITTGNRGIPKMTR